MPSLFRPSVLALLIAGITPVAWAEDAEKPIQIDADESRLKSGESAEVRGKVVIEQGNLKIESDWARYQIPEDRVAAGDAFKMTRDGNTLSGSKIDMVVGKREGEVTDPVLVMAGERARIDARKLLLEGPERYTVREGRFTTCPVNNDDWYIHSRELNLDYNRQIGQAWGSWLEFKGVPVFYYPWIDFPLDGNRKSGILAPTFSFDGSKGYSVLTPFYWNIAPNYDATLYPRYFEKRGNMIGGEFRYLGETYSGQIRAETIDDRLYGRGRFSEMLQHSQKLTPNLQLALNVQKVSDDEYLNDFGDRMSVSSQANLPREGVLTYTGDRWSSFLRWQRFQTLQSLSSPVDPPYARMPQLYATASPILNPWLQTDISAETTRFDHASKVKGQRTWAYPSVSVPLRDTYGFVTPKVGFHATQYDLTATDGSKTVARRTLPIMSLDSGLYFDRATRLTDGGGIQTLEPRAYYVYAPYRQQSNLPLFDTGETDLSFSKLFSENQFSGQDRINDANQLTLALTSRHLAQQTGQEQVRATLGQRFYLDKQCVSLSTDSSSQCSSVSRSDSLLSVGAQLWQNLKAEYDLQYSLENGNTRRASAGLSWQPADFQRINLRYTMNRIADPAIEQIDLSAQWPIYKAWYALGRNTYSLQDRRPLESLLGLEYNGGCWAVRVAGQRYITTNQTYNTRYFLVLELGGLAGVGNNPLDTIKQSIPGYTDTYNQPSLTKSTP